MYRRDKAALISNTLGEDNDTSVANYSNPPGKIFDKIDQQGEKVTSLQDDGLHSNPSWRLQIGARNLHSVVVVSKFPSMSE